MKIREMQDEIIRLKKEKDFCILAHSYMSPDILEIADICGDSFKLSEEAVKVKNNNLLMCGVRFMAECAKLLSPDKNVCISNTDAGCPMAEQIDASVIENFKKENPDYTVVAYVNTTAELKAVSDVCVTSSSAEKVVSQLDNDNILFIPDKNLGSYIAKKLPQKNIRLLDGCCPIHNSVTEDEAILAKKNHPSALFLVHPECRPEVVSHADYVGATSGIINFVRNSSATEFIIGTENSIRDYLMLEYPEKEFYMLSEKLNCTDMRKTSLSDIYMFLKSGKSNEITLSEDLATKANKPIEQMILLNK
ncbi:MAG: quinolinate synthase NadA [Clostridia bacterium]|nr:quinolinate synthase NadA [Clostridia bacterium]